MHAKEKEQFLPSTHDHRVILREVCYLNHAVFLIFTGTEEAKGCVRKGKVLLPL